MAVNFRSISQLMFRQLFSSHFRGKVFLFSLSEQFIMQVCVFQKKKLVSIKGNETHQRRKIGKKRNPKNKRKYVQKVHLKTSCNKSLRKLKESRKIMFDGKTVLLVVLWVRLIQIYLSLYFPFKIFMTILCF
jgi:hypothetical protein